MALPHLAGDTNMPDMSSADPFWGNEGNRYAPDPADVEPAPETAASASGHADAPQMVEEPEEEDDSEGESSSGSDWGNRSAKRTGPRKSSTKRRKKTTPAKRSSYPPLEMGPPRPPAPSAIPLPLYKTRHTSLDPMLVRQTQIDQHFRPQVAYPTAPTSLLESKRETPAVSTSQVTLIDAPTGRPRAGSLPKLLVPEIHVPASRIAPSSSASPTKPVPLPNFLHTLKKRMPRVPLIPNNDPLQLMQIFQEAQVRDKMRDYMHEAAARWAAESFEGLQHMSKPDQLLEKLWQHLDPQGQTISYFITPNSTLLITWLIEIARQHIPLSRWLDFRYPGSSMPDPELLTIKYPLDFSGEAMPLSPTVETGSPMDSPREPPQMTQLVPLKLFNRDLLCPDSPLTPPAELLRDEDIILGTVHRSSQGLARLVAAASSGEQREEGANENERTAGWELFTAYSLKDLERYERERWVDQ